jgi:hypothetical protein
VGKFIIFVRGWGHKIGKNHEIKQRKAVEPRKAGTYPETSGN